MANEERCPNDSIDKMIKNLKPCLKRPLSSNGSLEDIYESPVKKLKEMDSTYVGSPREVRRIRADLVHSRSTILSLENRIRHMHTVRKELEILFESERKSFNAQHERDRKSIEDLEGQLQTIRKREMEMRTELMQVKNQNANLKNETDIKIEKLEKSLHEYAAERQISDSEEATLVSSLKQKVSELELLYQAAHYDAQAHKKLAAELDKQLTEQKNIQLDFEQKEQALQKAQMYIKDLEYERETFKEFQEQAKNQHYKVMNYSQLEQENVKLKEDVRKLKDEVYNKLILEEEVHDLRSRLVKYNEQEKKLFQLQVKQLQDDKYLDEWRAIAREICESNASDGMLPRMLRKVVEDLQRQEINLMSEKVELESQLSGSQHEAKVAKMELEKNQKHMAELQVNIQQNQNFNHRLKKKLLLVSRERDSYRLQLDSYERDLTICVNPANTANPGANQLQTQKERIEELEKIVESYRELVTKLENDLQIAEPLPHAEITPVKSEQLARLQEEIDRMKTDNDFLRSRKDDLEIKLEELLVGQDQQLGRVLHPAINPFNDIIAERETELEKLKEEVVKLRRKVKNYEDGLEASKLGDVSICPKEVLALKEQVKNAEMHTQRLKDYFKSSMQEFRNVIYMLLGYKIDKAGNAQYKLTSMYAERAEDNLCFQLYKDGTLNLMENDFSMSLEEMVQLHLRGQRSIPVFLSSLTIDLFNNRTVAQSEEEDEEEEEVEENSDDD